MITTVTMNASLDKAYFMKSRIVNGTVMRLDSCRTSAGGKRVDKEYGSTEYLEPGCEVSSEEERRFLQAYPDIIRDSDVITISGSIPEGLKKDIYGRMITIARSMGKTVILDSSGEVLKQGIESCPTVVKPNQDEIEQLFDIRIHGIQDVVPYAEKIHAAGIPYVVVSMGMKGRCLFARRESSMAYRPRQRLSIP